MPGMQAALVSGALLAFALSFDEVIVTVFTAGAGTQTIPLWVLAAIAADGAAGRERRGRRPDPGVGDPCLHRDPYQRCRVGGQLQRFSAPSAAPRQAGRTAGDDGKAEQRAHARGHAGGHPDTSRPAIPAARHVLRPTPSRSARSCAVA